MFVNLCLIIRSVLYKIHLVYIIYLNKYKYDIWYILYNLIISYIQYKIYFYLYVYYIMYYIYINYIYYIFNIYIVSISVYYLCYINEKKINDKYNLFCQWGMILLHAQHFGLPQRRVRLFILGINKDRAATDLVNSPTEILDKAINVYLPAFKTVPRPVDTCHPYHCIWFIS